MAFPLAEHIVYNKDGEGSTYAVGEIVFEEQILQHDPHYSKLGNILKELPQFPTRPDDIWIIGYMKSGTHWLNEIINLLTRDAVTKPLSGKEYGFIEMAGRSEHFEQMESPRILNTHLQFKLMPRHILDNAKLVIPLRNPKSVAVSSYYHHVNIMNYEYDGTFAGHLTDFMQKINDFNGNWFETVTAYWEYLKGKTNVLFVVYEDLIQNPVEGIKEISDFLGLSHKVPFCHHVAEQAKFEAMRNREQQVIPGSQVMKGRDGVIRKGSTTDWKNHFTVAQNEMFDAVYEEKMKDFPDLKQLIRHS